MGKMDMIKVSNDAQKPVICRAINGIRVYRNIEMENYPVHWHLAMEIIMPCKNYYAAQVGGTSLTLNEGDILLIAPGELHSLITPPDKGERLIILLDHPSILQLSDMDSLLHLLHPYMLIRRSDNPEFAQELCACLSKIAQEYFENKPLAEASICSIFLRFFTLLGRNVLNATVKFPDIMPDKQDEYGEKFLAVSNYINDHFTENLTVDLLAAQTGFSKFHFSRLFKQFTGMTCYSYIISKRISCAEKFLVTPNFSITEAAMQSGFNSLSTFNRIFKTAKGCTPSEYRQLNNQSLKLHSGSTMESP